MTAGAYVLTAAENGVYTLEANPNYAGGYYRHQPNIQLLEVETARLDGSGDYDLIVGVTGRFGMESANRLLADGTTLLFVSHNEDQVKELCGKAVWLDHGRMMATGDVNEEFRNSHTSVLRQPIGHL